MRKSPDTRKASELPPRTEGYTLPGNVKEPLPQIEGSTPEARAIAAAEAGQHVDCSLREYQRVRQALSAHAKALADNNETERCRQIIDEIRALDAQIEIPRFIS